MALSYGFVKCKIASILPLQSKRRRREIQYHLHIRLSTTGHQTWDSAINVGTNDADDLLRFKLVYDLSHPILPRLQEADEGLTSLTKTRDLPALDFLRSDILHGTGPWRDSDVMDGSDAPEPVAGLKRLLERARSASAPVYVFGRTYTDGGLGVHDVHMNQGSTSDEFLNNAQDDHNDHNDIWQDGAVLVDFGEPQWAGYFTAFTQQLVPTDDLGNPKQGAHSINQSDEGVELA